SQGKKPWMFQEPRAKGKYIAFCEGDDFWTDPTKLERQVQRLNSDNSIVIVGTNAHVIGSDGTLKKQYNIDRRRKLYGRKCIKVSGAPKCMLTVCYRNVKNVYIDERCKAFSGDVFLFSILSEYGSYFVEGDWCSGVYRHHSGG